MKCCVPKSLLRSKASSRLRLTSNTFLDRNIGLSTFESFDALKVVPFSGSVTAQDFAKVMSETPVSFRPIQSRLHYALWRFVAPAFGHEHRIDLGFSRKLERVCNTPTKESVLFSTTKSADREVDSSVKHSEALNNAAMEKSSEKKSTDENDCDVSHIEIWEYSCGYIRSTLLIPARIGQLAFVAKGVEATVYRLCTWAGRTVPFSFMDKVMNRIYGVKFALSKQNFTSSEANAVPKWNSSVFVVRFLTVDKAVVHNNVASDSPQHLADAESAAKKKKTSKSKSDECEKVKGTEKKKSGTHLEVKSESDSENEVNRQRITPEIEAANRQLPDFEMRCSEQYLVLNTRVSVPWQGKGEAIWMRIYGVLLRTFVAIPHWCAVRTLIRATAVVDGSLSVIAQSVADECHNRVNNENGTEEQCEYSC